MDRFFVSIITIGIVFGALVFLFGIRATENIDASFSARFEYSPEYLFDFISDVSKYPDRKKDIESLEVLKRQGQKIVAWRENYKNGTWLEYDLVRETYPKIFEIELVNSSNDHTALITYSLGETDGFTEIVLTEKGKIENTFRRGLRSLSGDDSFLESQIKWLRVAIQTEQINRP